MDVAGIVAYISRHYYGVAAIKAPGAWFFCYDPHGELDPLNLCPFASLIVSDGLDGAAGSDGHESFRLNIGTQPSVYRAVYGPAALIDPEGTPVKTGFASGKLFAVVPHQIYAGMGWVSILSPSDEGFEACKPMIRNAYRAAVVEYNEQIQSYQEETQGKG